ncbi:unnamed protein product [Ixodes persulcatus]
MTAAALPCVPTRADKRLRKVLLTNKTVACNDGSPAGYYIRKWHGSRRWIIFLEGECPLRLFRKLLYSLTAPSLRTAGNGLCAFPSTSKGLCTLDETLIDFCRGRFYSPPSVAETEKSNEIRWSLLANKINAARELLTSCQSREFDIFWIPSAGGAGVLLNVDRVADLLGSLGSRVKVRGVADSGWFLDNEPFEPRECLEPHSCAPLEVIKRGMKLWQGQVPERCKPTYPEDEQWRCYFGYRIYPTLRAPTFVFQWLFDEAQMTVDNVAAPSSKAQWDYIHSMGSKLRSTLSNVTALFAPSCISHMVLTKRNWQSVQICGISLPQALRCWELQRHEHNHHEHHPRHHLYDRLPTRDNETK